MVYQLIALATAALSAIWGFRKGASRQLPSVIGMALGIVSARLLSPGLQDILYGAFPSVHGTVEQTFVYDTISSAIVFAAVYFIFKTLTSFISKAFPTKEMTILNELGGSVYGAFRYLMALSIVFNMMIALGHGGALLDYVKSDDGNVVEEVMLLAPALLGGEDAVELAHKIQLEEAKKIS